MKLTRVGILLLVLGLVFATGCFGFLKKEYTISGIVVDTDGEPIEGVKIVITRDTSAETETDAEGKWSAKVKGKVTVTPVHEDYEFEPKEVEVEKASSDVNFVGTYLAVYSISGVVVDDEDNPLADVTVLLSGQVSREAITDEEGKWSFEDIRGTNTVTAVDDDLAYIFESVEVTEAETDITIKGTYVLIAHYDFAENEGVTIADLSKNENDATLIGEFTGIEGPTGTAMQFNGTDNYVKMPDGIISELEEITVATWVRVDERKYWSRVFSFGNNAGDPEDGVMFLAALGSNFETDQHEGWLKFDWAVYGIEGSAIFIMGPILEEGKWYHVAVTLTADRACLYVDGELYGSTANIALPKDMGITEQNYIGRSNSRWNDPLLKGAIGDFRIYSIALPAEAIATLAE